MVYKIKKASYASLEVKSLSDELHKDLEAIYGNGIIEDFIDENEQMLIFYVAYDEKDNAISYGALKHFDDSTAEVKRMYVKPQFRGRGISKLILKQLESYAEELNYQSISSRNRIEATRSNELIQQVRLQTSEMLWETFE